MAYPFALRTSRLVSELALEKTLDLMNLHPAQKKGQWIYMRVNKHKHSHNLEALLQFGESLRLYVNASLKKAEMRNVSVSVEPKQSCTAELCYILEQLRISSVKTILRSRFSMHWVSFLV